MVECRICGDRREGNSFVALEMMFGWREEFAYFQCAACGCLQISDIPADLQRYYPQEYYSFRPTVRSEQPKTGKLKAFFRRRRLQAYLGERDILGMVVLAILGTRTLPAWVKRPYLKPDARILEIGCGAGDLLLYLRDQGFSHLVGVDPYIDRDMEYPGDINVYKKELSDIGGEYDFVMLHHAFEHMSDPLTALKQIASLVNDGGSLLIRVPVVPSFAWEKYGVDWVQLDAPRHLFLHSKESLRLLCGQAGLEIVDVVYDSTAFQFWGSEQYSRNIPLIDPRSYWFGQDPNAFPRDKIRYFEKLAQQLNRQGAGDQACFFLRKGLRD